MTAWRCSFLLEITEGIRDLTLFPGSSQDLYHHQHFWACSHPFQVRAHSHSCSMQYPIPAKISSDNCPAHPGTVARPQSPSTDCTNLLLLRKSAPGTTLRSPRVTACHLPCTTVNPISSSFFTHLSSNWKHWEFWLACWVIEKYYGEALKSCCERRHMPEEPVRYSCSFPFEVVHSQGTAGPGVARAKVAFLLAGINFQRKNVA